jgi:hypothetical protein
MPISFDLPPDVQSLLASQFDDLSQAAKEAFAIEGYRTRKFGLTTVRRILGFETRWDAEKWLTEHDVPMNYTCDDLEADRETLDRVLDEQH